MAIIFQLLGVGLIVLILVDSFETTVLPRRVTHRFRFARLFFPSLWALWRGVSLCFPAGKFREGLLSLFGPLSILGLLLAWVTGLIFAFPLLNWSLEIPIH